MNWLALILQFLPQAIQIVQAVVTVTQEFRAQQTATPTGVVHTALATDARSTPLVTALTVLDGHLTKLGV